MDGLFNEYSYFNGAKETVQEILKHYDELGGPTTYPHYAAGWASRETLLSLGRSRLRLALQLPFRFEVGSLSDHLMSSAPE
jgi:hypothetical protein